MFRLIFDAARCPSVDSRAIYTQRCLQPPRRRFSLPRNCRSNRARPIHPAHPAAASAARLETQWTCRRAADERIPYCLATASNQVGSARTRISTSISAEAHRTKVPRAQSAPSRGLRLRPGVHDETLHRRRRHAKSRHCLIGKCSVHVIRHAVIRIAGV